MHNFGTYKKNAAAQCYFKQILRPKTLFNQKPVKTTAKWVGVPHLWGTLGLDGFWFLVCYAATLLALQVQQERIQVVHSNRVAQNRPTRGHFRNGPWT